MYGGLAENLGPDYRSYNASRLSTVNNAGKISL